MITLKTKSTCGNFTVEAEAEVTQEQLEILGNFGLLQILQRSPMSKGEKVLAGYEKRPAGFKRDSIPFSDANADKLAEVLSEPIEIAEGDTIECAVNVTEYVPTEADVKMADERAAYGRRNGDTTALKALADKVGYAGEIGNGKADEAPVEFLRAIRAWSKAQTAAL